MTLTFAEVTAIGVAVAITGFSLQVVYLPQSIFDLRISLRKARAAQAAAATEIERQAARRDGRTQIFYVLARIANSVALMTVHVVIVVSIAVVLKAVRPGVTPSATAFQLAWSRVVVSGVVVVATSSQLAARWWALHL